MQIWSAEIKELESLYTSIKGRFPELEKELEQLFKFDDANVIMLYSRRCLEVIITDLCECELKRPRKTEPLKGIIDKLNREEKVPAHIIASMHSLNSLSTFGAHPKEFDPRQVKPVLSNLAIIIEWQIKHKNIEIVKITEEKIPDPVIITSDKDYRVPYSFSKSRKSIIVLPFENMSPDPDQEYFSDGLTEEIITDLSHIDDLLVISRSSSMTFKGTKKKIREIGKEVDVRYVLEGSVRKAGNNLRIIAQLIDVETDTHLWAEKYTGFLDDVFKVQEKVSRSIVDALKLTLSPEEDLKISYHPIKNIKAYECYLQARQEIYRFTEKELERGLQLIKNGLEIIGDNELLYATMGTAYYFYVDAGIKPGDLYLQKAEECVQKIFRKNPESSYGHYLLGSIHFLRGNMQQAVRDLKKSLAGDPNNPDCLLQLVRIYCSCGKNDAAGPLLEKALVLDPLNTIIHSLPGYLQLLSGQFDAAVESYYKMYRLDPESPIFRWFYAWALIYAMRNEEAFKIIDQLAVDFPGTTFASYGLFIKNALLGKKQEALKIITPELEAAAKGVEYHSRGMAHGYALLGQTDMALEWLENTVDCGFINYPFMAEIDPFLKNFRGEDRFKKLIKRVRHEWENFEV